MRNPSKGGTPLPLPFKSFEQYGIALRRGELTMIAAEPGAGKSTVALKMALAMKQPTLYFSPDSPEEVQTIRSLAMITGLPQHQVEANMESDPETGWRLMQEHAGHIAWDYDTASMWDIEEEFQIYEELTGAPPALVILDNATDITYESGDEYQSLRALARDLKAWARATNSCMVILHHTSEGFTGNPCPPRAAIHGKVSQKPANIWTIGDAKDGFMPISPVKNRGGFSDKTGGTAIWLRYDPVTMLLRDSS
jgi:predicted ATP-dependent serine protease